MAEFRNQKYHIKNHFAVQKRNASLLFEKLTITVFHMQQTHFMD